MRNAFTLFGLLLFTRLVGQASMDSTRTALKPPPVQLDLAHMPSTYSYANLGIFCKLDVQLERRLRMPVLFRLGDARQVEAWEGKGPLAMPLVER